jgi:hypothetical protein
VRRDTKQSGILKATAALWALAVLLLAMASSIAGAEEQAAKPAQARRLIAKLDAEPLLAIYAEDARALPAKFAQTSLSAMLHDPNYAKGLATVRALFNEGAGGDLTALWPDFSSMLEGPLALVLCPVANAGPTDPDFKLLLLAATPSAESAKKLAALWPKAPPQASKLFAALQLQAVLTQDLPPEESLPAWLAKDGWPQGDVCVRLLPRKLSAAFGKWLGKDETTGLGLVAPFLNGIYDEATECVRLGVTFRGEQFQESLQIDTLPQNAALAHAVQTLRERPAAWDALMAATPGDHDLTLLLQLDLGALGPDLPIAAQAMERYLRGRKWARGKGRLEDALDPRRFEFLTKLAEGTVSVAAKPALSGDLRVTVTTALGGEGLSVDALRAGLIKGLGEAGAEFETLTDARRIGGAAPLGARFQGRGMFGAPVVGLSPGWAWLCSSSAAYHELTGAFKTGRTMAAAHAGEKAALKSAGKPEDWHQGDAVRLSMELEKVLKLGYASWLLMGGETPAIGSWKVPGDLLPPPIILNNRLGVLHAGMSRQGNTLRAYATCALPGASLLLPGMVYEAADTIENARHFRQEALDMEDAPVKPQAKAGAPVLIEDGPAQDKPQTDAEKKP